MYGQDKVTARIFGKGLMKEFGRGVSFLVLLAFQGVHWEYRRNDCSGVSTKSEVYG